MKEVDVLVKEEEQKLKAEEVEHGKIVVGEEVVKEVEAKVEVEVLVELEKEGVQEMEVRVENEEVGVEVVEEVEVDGKCGRGGGG